MAKRRGNNEGSIYRRKDGYWVGQYGVQTGTGRKTHYIYGKRREEVREKLAKTIADRDGGFIFDDENMSVGEYLKRWLNDSVRGSVRASTYASYERQVQRLAVMLHHPASWANESLLHRSANQDSRVRKEGRFQKRDRP